MKLKSLRAAAWLLLLVLGIASLAACGKKDEEKTPETTAAAAKYTVTFYDGEAVLKTVEAESGTTVSEYTPTKEGYTFAGWFATPSLNREFDFTAAITKDTDVFSAWKSDTFTEDSREWMLAGESALAGAPLNKNSWGKVTGEDKKPYLLTRAEGTNEFTITIDLYQGDKFQVAEIDEADFAWKAQRGYGYISQPDETLIVNAGNAFTDSTKTANIEIAADGNYTVVLTTDPENEAMDSITVVRNGDASQALESTYTPNLSGTVTGGNAIADASALGDCGLVLNEETGAYETEISLNQGDYFSVLLNVNSWDTVLRTGQVDAAASDPCYDPEAAANVTVTKQAKYKISVVIPEDTAENPGSIIIKEIGEFERTEGDNEVIFRYPDGTELTSYVRNGARVPDPGKPEIPAERIFVGWYSDLENNVPMAFTAALTASGESFTCVPKFMGDQDEDTRSVYLKGTMNGWAGNDENYKMERTENHIYTAKVTLAESDQVMFTVFEGTSDTGYTVNGSSVDYENSTDKASGAGNITFSAAGTYEFTYDSFNGVITVKEAK